MRVHLALSLLLLVAPATGWPAQARSLPYYVLESRARAMKFGRERVEVSLPSGTLIAATVMKPDKAEARRLPLILVFGGFENAAKVLDLLNPSFPAVIASFDYPFTPPRTFEFPSSLKFAPQAKAAVKDTLVAIREVHARLLQRPDVDPMKTSIIGASFGSPFAVAAAASNPKIQGVILVHAFGDVQGTAMHRLLQKWKPKYGFLAHPMAWAVSKAAWWYLDAPSPEAHALKLWPGQRVLMIAAEADSFVPPAASDVLWEALSRSQAKAERVVMPGDHLQPGSDKLMAEISELVTKWMKDAGLR